MKLALSLFGAGALCTASFGQFFDNFESENASTAGTLITGQNGWYLPSVGGVDGNVFTYAGNALGFANNATGGNNFVGMLVTTAGGTNRAQHAVNMSSGNVWTLSYDFNANFNGTPPAADNLGSVSLQDSTVSNYFQTIFQWGTNTATASAFNANIGHFTAGGSTAGGIVFESPGAAWTNLTLNHWYHQTVSWDFGSGLITDTTLRDMTANGSVSDFQPTGWYLAGGANNTLGLSRPTDVRLFASGSAGDMMGYDNVAVPEPASMTVIGMGVLAMIRKRRNRK